MSAISSTNYMTATNHAAFNKIATLPAAADLQSSRMAATSLDDAINRLRSSKQEGGEKLHQAYVSSPLKGPVLSPRGITSANSGPSSLGGTQHHPHQFAGKETQATPGSFSKSYKTMLSPATPLSSNMIKQELSGPGVAASRKPAIPPQLQRQGSFSSPLSTCRTSSSPSRSSSTGSYGDSSRSPAAAAVIFDAQGKCTCCPFGYHVDIDFVNFSQDIHSPTATFNRPDRKTTASVGSLSPQSSYQGTTHYQNLFIDDMEERKKPVTVDVYGTTQSQAPPLLSRTYVERSFVSPAPMGKVHDETHSSGSGSHLAKSDSTDTIDSATNYSNQIKTTRRIVTSTQLAETMATHLPDSGDTALTISAQSVKQIKNHMALSLQRMQELEEQVKVIPMMQERIVRLKADKKTLAEQLTDKSGVSCMRSIGVGDYDIHAEDTKIEKVIQTVVQEAPPKPSRCVGVGNYDVTVEYVTEAEAYHTMSEQVQRIKEKEIQAWIEEGEAALASKRAAMRSFGVGDGDVNAAPETIKVKETEVKTVYLEPVRPELRNVGLQVKPSMRDVCIEFSYQEEKPLTRSCGINVDIEDIIQEMKMQSSDSTDYSEVESGLLTMGQQTTWQLQKHVIQRRFMEAMHRGTQKDLVAFITGLLRRSVKSVGVTAKPETKESGMKTSSSLRGVDVGVSNDTVDVTVKPTVRMKDNFCAVRPSTRTQPTWTDLVLTCDSATNTQPETTDRASNTEPVAPQKQATVSTTLELRPAHRYTIVKELYTGHTGQATATITSNESQLPQSSSLKVTPARTFTSTKVIKTSSTSTANGAGVSELSKPQYVAGVSRSGEISKEYVDELLSSPKTEMSGGIEKISQMASSNAYAVKQAKGLVEDGGSVTEILHGVKTEPDVQKESIVTVTEQVSGTTPSDQLSTHSHSVTTHATSVSQRSGERIPALHSARNSSSTSRSSSTSHTAGTSQVHEEYSETLTRKGSGDEMQRMVSSSSRMFSTKLPDFSNYFSRESQPPPTGQAERMKRYDNSTYITTSTAEIERNKTEMSGDPLKARYNIDDLSKGTVSDVSIATHSVGSFSSQHQNSSKTHTQDSLRSIMKKDSASTPPRNITFAEQAEVTEVIEDVNDGISGGEDDKDADIYTDEESEVSFEEGTYDGRKGDVSYHCDHDQTTTSNLVKSKSQEEIDIDVELQAACSIVQQHLESGDMVPNTKMSSALSVIQQDWFKVASSQQANLKEVDGYMACFEDFSIELLEYIVNMTDGNGNAALHYAVSHCNFPIVKLIVDSGVADVNLQNKAGYTPIMLAALADVQTEDDRIAIQLLLSRGNVNLAASQAGQTALMLAVSHGRLEMVELLLESGADVNMKDDDGSTALMCATEHGHVDIVKTLLSHPDIDMSLKDTDGSTALEIALENSQKEISILLYAKEQANKANSTVLVKNKTSRIVSSANQSRNVNKASRVVTIAQGKY